MENHEEIKISELIKVFFNRINLILYSTLVCIFFSLIYILATPKIYISETIIEFPVNKVSVLEGDELLKNYGPTKDYIKEVKTACLWKKKSSKFEPDFCPIKLDSDPWIVQPTEHYEELSIEEIMKKNK